MADVQRQEQNGQRRGGNRTDHQKRDSQTKSASGGGKSRDSDQKKPQQNS